jgi:hypothetical protein
MLSAPFVPLIIDLGTPCQICCCAGRQQLLPLPVAGTLIGRVG